MGISRDVVSRSSGVLFPCRSQGMLRPFSGNFIGIAERTLDRLHDLIWIDDLVLPCEYHYHQTSPLLF